MRPILRFSSLLFILLGIFSNYHAGLAQEGVSCPEIPMPVTPATFCVLCDFEVAEGTTVGQQPSGQRGDWCNGQGVIDNDQYYGFFASAPCVEFTVTVGTCLSGDGIQAAIFDGGGGVPGSCFPDALTPGTTTTLTSCGLTAGEPYFIGIDGFSGAQCNFTIQVISGLDPAPPPPMGPVMGPTEACFDSDFNLSVDPLPNVSGYYWEITAGAGLVGYTVDPSAATLPPAGSEENTITITIPPAPIFVAPGQCEVMDITVRPQSPCFPDVGLTNFSTFQVEVCLPQGETVTLPVCGTDGEVEYPPGSGDFYAWSPLGYVVNRGPIGPTPCDVFDSLYTELQQNNFSSTVRQYVLCEGEGFTDPCGIPEPTPVPGANSCTIEYNQPGQCDSTIFYNVTILDPVAEIEARGFISCTQPTDELFAVTRTTGIPPSSSGDTISYAWLDGAGATIGTDESIVVSAAGTYTLRVSMTSDLDPGKVCTEERSITIADQSQAPNPPAVAGDFQVCADAVPQTYTASGATAGDTYVWSTNPATGVTSTTNGDQLTISDFGTLTTLEVCAATQNACGTSSQTCETITVLPLPTPVTLTGADFLCEGEQSSYTIGNYDAAWTYAVTGPAGATATLNGASVDVTMGNAAGQLCVIVSNSCQTLPAVCVDIMLRPEAVATTPTGATEVCAGDQEDYNVHGTLPAGTTASVSVTGGTVLSQNGGTVSVDWTTAGAGEVCVTLTNECGDSQPACLPVTVNTAGSATLSGGGDYCAGNNDLEVRIDFVGAGPYTYTYTVDGAPTTATTTDNPVVITAPGVGTYELTQFAVGTCNGTASGTATVAEDPTPTATLSGGGDLCVGEDTDLTIAFTGDAPWTYELALDGAGQGPVTTSDNPVTVTVTDDGTYTLLSVTSDAGCVGTASGSAVVNELAPIVATAAPAECNGTGETYTITITIGGGDPGSYVVTPAGVGSVSGTTFTSAPIASGDSYLFQISDANDCAPVIISGDFTCPCETAVGTMSGAAVTLCDDGSPTDFAAGYDASGEFQDANDARVFTLHTGAGAAIAGAIATNASGSFGFTPGTMTYGTTYYVSAVVGDADGAGGVDLTDDCTVVSAGTPVVWYEEPTALISGGADLCPGEDATLTIEFTGSAPWTYEYALDGAGQGTVTTSDNPLTITVADAGTYTLSSVSGPGGCVGTVDGQAVVTVATPIVVTPESFDCDGTGDNYTVTFTVSGGDASSYVVTPAGVGSIAGGVFTSTAIASGDSYLFQISDAANCDPVIVSGDFTCACETAIGTMATAPVELCDDGSATDFSGGYDPTGEFLDDNDVRAYVLHTGAGATITGAIASNASGAFGFGAGMSYGTTYYVSVTVGNDDGSGGVDLSDDCSLVVAGTPVVWYEIPTATLGAGADVCTGEDASIEVAFTGTGPFTYFYTVNGTALQGSSATSPAVIDLTGLTETTTVVLTGVETAQCAGTAAGTAVVEVREEVAIVFDAECNPTATGYTVTIDITGGDPGSYTVTPADGTLTGSQFVSTELNPGEGYSFTVTDQYGCNQAVAAQATVVCNCLSDAGDMSPTAVTLCGDGAIDVPATTGAFDDADDVLNYILHDGTGNAVGANVFAQGPNPSFTFGPPLVYGTTYYVSAVMGNDDGSGTTDLSDPCLDVAVGTPVVWNETPTVILTGDQDVCEGEPIELIVVVTGGAAVDIVLTDGTQTWDFTFAEGATTFAAPLATTATYTVSSATANGCAGVVSGQAAVTVHEGITVSTPGMIEYNGTVTQYRVTFTISGGDPSSYTVDGAPITGSTFTSPFIDCGNGYSFVFDDQWNCDPQTRAATPDCDCVTQIGSISTDFATCDPDEVATFAYDPTGETRDSDDGLEWILHAGDYNVPIARNTTGSFAFDPAVMTEGQTYFVTAVLGNFDGTNVDLGDNCTLPTNQLSAVWAMPPTVTLTGDAAVCPGVPTDLTFAVTGPGDITVDFTDGTNNYREVLNAGTVTLPTPAFAGASATFEITGVSTTACPGTFSGTATITLLDGPRVDGQPRVEINPTVTGYTVTIDIVGGDAATYTIDGTPLGGATSFTSAEIACGTPYSFTLTDAGGCDPVLIEGNPDCNCLTRVGTLTGGLSTCDLDEVAEAVYDAAGEVQDGDDATEFILYQTDVNAAVAKSPTPSFAFDAGTMLTGVTYFIVAATGNATGGTVDLDDACTQLSDPVAVAWYEEPTATLSGPNAICAGDDLVVVFEVTGSPEAKSIAYEVDGVAATVDNVVPGTPAAVTIPATGSTTITLTGVSDANCAGVASASITVDISSEIALTLLDEACDGTGTEYVVSFEIAGGDASTYVVSPAGSGTIAPGSPVVFTSNPIASGGSYDFTVTDASGCFSPNLANTIRCDCGTDAGSMTSLSETIVCEGEDFVGTFADGTGALDPNDVRGFVLRTDDDRTDYTDDQVAYGPTPVFPTTGLTPGVVYYISPVAGDDDGAGVVDPNDPCLSIGLGQPFQLRALPGGSLSGATTVCGGGGADITVALTGTGPFDVVITDDAGAAETLTGISTGHVYTVSPTVGTTYTLTSVTESTDPRCAVTPNSAVEIRVEDELSAGVAAAALELCEGTGEVVELAALLTGADAGGAWTQVGGPAAGVNFSATDARISNNSLAPGQYAFSYTVGEGTSCPVDEETVALSIEAGPEADAGADQQITCDDPVVQLGAPEVAGYQYTWSGGTVSDPAGSAPTTSEAGTFVLTVVSGAAGCEGTDEVVVESAGDLPAFDGLLERDISCFGETDGAVFTDVTGGVGPYTFSLDDGRPTNAGQFTNLAPGAYQLQVIDAEGCAYTETIEIEAAKEVIVDAGPNAEIEAGEGHDVQLYLEGDVETVTWTGDSILCTSTGPLCDRATLFPTVTGTYQVTVRDSNGCVAEDVIQLIVRRDRPVFVNTGFSPNGDGINDYVFVQAPEGVVETVVDFRIFDRWGEVMYSRSDINPNDERNGWDGRFRGELLNPAVFAYWCTIRYGDGSEEILRGDITLLTND